MTGGEEGEVKSRLHQTNGPHGDYHGTETAIRERTDERTNARATKRDEAVPLCNLRRSSRRLTHEKTSTRLSAAWLSGKPAV